MTSVVPGPYPCPLNPVNTAEAAHPELPAQVKKLEAPVSHASFQADHVLVMSVLQLSALSWAKLVST